MNTGGTYNGVYCDGQILPINNLLKFFERLLIFFKISNCFASGQERCDFCKHVCNGLLPDLFHNITTPFLSCLGSLSEFPRQK